MNLKLMNRLKQLMVVKRKEKKLGSLRKKSNQK